LELLGLTLPALPHIGWLSDQSQGLLPAEWRGCDNYISEGQSALTHLKL
jgi:hypothetical protein